MDDIRAKIKVEAQKLIGKECWAITGGKGTSRIDLSIGEKIPMKKPIKNPSISEDAQKYDSQYALFVLCAWRIDTDTEVICGTLDYDSKDGKILQGLNLLKGKKIKRVELSEPAWDLTVEFTDSLTLKIFCNQTNEKEDLDNYDLFTPTEVITVSVKSELKCEPRDFS